MAHPAAVAKLTQARNLVHQQDVNREKFVDGWYPGNPCPSGRARNFTKHYQGPGQRQVLIHSAPTLPPSLSGVKPIAMA